MRSTRATCDTNYLPEKPDRYLAKALRSAGVPNLWIEDAIQDIRILLWQHPDSDALLVIRSGAIDAARRYGRHSRSGVERDCISLEARFGETRVVSGAVGREHVAGSNPLPPQLWAHDDYPQRLDIDAVNGELARLSPRWREALSNSVNRKHQSNGMEQAATKAKRRLRQRCA